MDDVRQVLVVGYPSAELLDIACVNSSLQIANYLSGRRVYQLRLASPGGAPIRTATGLIVQAEVALEHVREPVDTLIVSGGLGYTDAIDNPILVAHVRRLARHTRRVASVCTGAGVLAAAGLLDGQRAATHWQHAAFLTARFPAVDFDDQPIYIADGRVSTSAGVTAALDLMLLFIEQDVGAELARQVARELVTYLQRPGNQAQMSMFTAAPPTRSSPVRDTLDHIETNLGADLTTASLADRVGVSDRHLARLFRKELSTSPARFVRRARAEAAAHLLTGTDLTVEAIAIRCGYGTVETLRQAFQRTFGVSPSHYRATQSRPALGQDQRTIMAPERPEGSDPPV